MIDDVRYITNNQVSVNDTGNTNAKSKAPSFKGKTNAVDKTPAVDTYQPQSIPS